MICSGLGQGLCQIQHTKRSYVNFRRFWPFNIAPYLATYRFAQGSIVESANLSGGEIFMQLGTFRFALLASISTTVAVAFIASEAGIFSGEIATIIIVLPIVTTLLSPVLVQAIGQKFSKHELDHPSPTRFHFGKR